MDQILETCVGRAKQGDKAALEEVVRRIQDRVYNLAIRMLWHPADAEDATQEILIKVVTHLSDFRGESAFTTWVYRIASNYLLTTRKRMAEQPALTFEQFGADLDQGLSDEPFQVPPDADQNLLVEEVKIGCTQGMLLCLDREHRIAYILGEIFEVTSEEGGEILTITPAAFRKRLSRARGAIRNFMQRKCGIVNPDNPCRCARRVNCAIQKGYLDPNRLLFAGHPAQARSDPMILARIHEIEVLERAAAVFHSHPNYTASEKFVEGIKKLVDSGGFKILGG
jgi:RNA polymerase sigma factor (sigma-70 family)